MTNSTFTHDINKIHCDSNITVKHINMTSLLFVDNLAVSKSRYSIVDNFINLVDQAEDNICLYQHRGSSSYFEYETSLNTAGVILSGYDKYGNVLNNLTQGGILVFVDGYKLLPSQFEILDDNSLKILNKYVINEISTVIIYSSSSLVYVGNPDTMEDWNPDEVSFVLDDYTYLRYLFFLNGELITRDKINKINKLIKININYRQAIDIISIYRLPVDTENLLFNADPGYFSYGPRDNAGILVPEVHDVEVTFDNAVKYVIDDVRNGFFIKQDGNQDGCLMIVGNDFETPMVYCTEIVRFPEGSFTQDDYFVQVPDARSILKYISEYDLNRMLMPEILGSFQKLLLNETYDSIQRIKNSRNISKVDSKQIGNLISFLGLNFNITNLSLEKKHALLEELTNFYRIVGTRESYNFYNILSTNTNIVDMQQLFTPIRDIYSAEDVAERYVDFRTPAELGAETHTKYDYPTQDFGLVDVLANQSDSFTNNPRSQGVLQHNEIPAIFSNTKVITRMGPDGEIITEELSVEKNEYTQEPVSGPNQSNIDYGYIVEDAVSFYDLGYVYEVIRGKWIEWTTWDRPKNWYPTNHVDISVQIPSDVDYKTFMTEFKNTFYNIASAVLYIHSVIEVYVFGKENPWQTDEEGSGTATFDMLAAPYHYDITYSFTNDPARQDYRAY